MVGNRAHAKAASSAAEAEAQRHFSGWMDFAPEWQAEIASSPMAEVVDSAFATVGSWGLWYREAYVAASAEGQAFESLIAAAYLQGMKILLSRIFALKRLPPSPAELRTWCQLQNWAIGVRASIDLAFAGSGRWPQSDELFFSWRVDREMPFVKAMLEMDTHLRAGRASQARKISSRHPKGFADSGPDHQTRGLIEKMGSPPARIRRAGWDAMRHLCGRNRPAEPIDPPTWETAVRDLDLIAAWCDEQEAASDAENHATSSGPVTNPPSNNGSARAVELILGTETGRILQIIESDESADSKMREICGIDRRYLAWSSPRWAEVLGVSDAAIRATRLWKKDRPRAIGRGE